MTRSGHDRVVMLTRYPTPGAAKRRLADALGPEAAAIAHREVAGYCFDRLTPLAATREAVLEVRHAGGSPRSMREWLAGPAIFREQGDGHLGDRLRTAAADAFAEGAERVALLGSDCPDAGARTVRRAFEMLDSHDLVLGPAEDGGYYLMAVKRSLGPAALADVFGDAVPWGGPDVLDVTRAIASRRGLDVGELPSLADIDRPADLAILKRVRARAQQVRENPRVSVVIPAWNEAPRVPAAVGSAIDGGAFEVVVADCGSVDGTTQAAADAGASVVCVDRPNRAAQMNAGARAARGDVLLFLHADCVLPPGFVEHVRDALATPGVVAGAFAFGAADEPAPSRLLIQTVGAARARFGLPYGDQALFVPAVRFADLGGFPDQPTMEDYELALRLRRLGRIARVPAPVLSSTRVWRAHGLVRPTAAYVAIIVGYRLGVSAERLAPCRLWMTNRAKGISVARGR